MVVFAGLKSWPPALEVHGTTAFQGRRFCLVAGDLRSVSSAGSGDPRRARDADPRRAVYRTLGNSQSVSTRVVGDRILAAVQGHIGGPVDGVSQEGLERG